MLQLKKAFPEKISFQRTGIFSWLGFQGKLYTAVIILLLGIIAESWIILAVYSSLHKDIVILNHTHEHIITKIQSLNEVSPSLLSRCQLGLLGGTGLEINDILTKLEADINSLDDTGLSDIKPLNEKYQLLSTRLREYRNQSLTKPQYLAIKKLYGAYEKELNNLEQNQNKYYQAHLSQPFLKQIWVLIGSVVLLVIVIVLCWRLFIAAVKSVTKPAKLMTEVFSNTQQQVFNISIPITSSEGLGKVGLLLNESFSHWDSIFLETRNAIQRFDALCKEFVTEVRKTELFTIQVQQVAEVITNNVKEENRLITRVNEELSFLDNGSKDLREIPPKMKTITDELKNQLVLGETQINGILSRVIEYQDESNEITDLAENLVRTSMEIIEAIKVLEEVAERTQLLAFNTAIQAARAGEKGLGFGVVAKEITKLVDRSKKASTRLSELLHKTQKKNDQILHLFNRQSTKAEQIYQTVSPTCINVFEKARTSFEDIAQLIKVMERIFQMLNELVNKEELIFNLPKDEQNAEHSFEVEILDYQLNVKEANRMAANVSEMAEELRKLAESAANESLLPF